MLISGRVDVNLLSSRDGLTPLMVAAQNGHNEACQLLVDVCARLESHAPRSLGTALFFALGHRDTLSLLISCFANAAAVTRGVCETAVMTAAGEGYSDAIAPLLHGKADINSRDRDGHTAVFYAARNNSNEALAELARHRAALDCVNSAGHTAWMAAVSGGALQATLELMRQGCDSTLAAPDGRNAHCIAHDAGQRQCAHLIHVFQNARWYREQSSLSPALRLKIVAILMSFSASALPVSSRDLLDRIIQ